MEETIIVCTTRRLGRSIPRIGSNRNRRFHRINYVNKGEEGELECL